MDYLKEIKEEMRTESRRHVLDLLNNMINYENIPYAIRAIADPVTDSEVHELRDLAKAVKQALIPNINGNAPSIDKFQEIGLAYYRLFNYYWFYSSIAEEELDKEAKEIYEMQFD